jgi:hypothetical protein
MARALLLAVLLASGCSRIMGTSDAGRAAEPIRQYPDGADGLKALFSDVLDAARKDDRQRVHDLLASLIMTDEDLRALFGAQGAELKGRYVKLMETLVNRGAVELVAQVYERKLDTVEVLPMEGEVAQAIARAAVQPLKLYSVRIRRAADDKGLRYDFFLYRDGKWRTGNLLGKYLAPARDGGS